MKVQFIASISTIAAAVLLVGCASNGPVGSTGAPSAAATARDVSSSEYQQLAANASDQLVCRWEVVTGSRIGSEVCRTRAQLEEQRERSQEAMRDIRASAAAARSIPAAPPMPPSSPRGTP
jgi:hypothetical protein